MVHLYNVYIEEKRLDSVFDCKMRQINAHATLCFFAVMNYQNECKLLNDLLKTIEKVEDRKAIEKKICVANDNIKEWQRQMRENDRLATLTVKSYKKIKLELDSRRAFC